MDWPMEKFPQVPTLHLGFVSLIYANSCTIIGLVLNRGQWSIPWDLQNVARASGSGRNSHWWCRVWNSKIIHKNWSHCWCFMLVMLSGLTVGVKVLMWLSGVPMLWSNKDLVSLGPPKLRCIGLDSRRPITKTLTYQQSQRTPGLRQGCLCVQ